MHPVPSVDVRSVEAADLLLDVREPGEWAAGRAPDAVHVPLFDLPDRLDDVPRDRRVAVICRVGSRSAQATAFLRAHGVQAVNVDGGMLAWAAAGLPVVGDADPPHVL